jgi:hypothetical protein
MILAKKLDACPVLAYCSFNGPRGPLSFPVVTISFKRPDHRFWSNATSNDLYMLDLQELFTHLFCANQRTTEAFLKWVPSSCHAGLELSEQAAHRLAMLTAPITYSNEDCDRRQCMSAWAMANVPAGMWVEFRNWVAYQRHEAEREAQKLAA